MSLTLVIVLSWMAIACLRRGEKLYFRWRDHVRKVSTCGYLPEPPSARAVRVMKFVARLQQILHLSRVRIVGRENLQVPGPSIITPNHSGIADGAVVALALDGPTRFMADGRNMRSFAGLPTILVVHFGGFAVDTTSGKGGPALDAAVNVVASGQRLVMFPEGVMYLDGVPGRFKKGAVRIARAASQKTGNPVYLVPMRIEYSRYAGPWFRKIRAPWSYVLMMLWSSVFHPSATVIIGKAISSFDLPADDAAATEMLKGRLFALTA